MSRMETYNQTQMPVDPSIATVQQNSIPVIFDFKSVIIFSLVVVLFFILLGVNIFDVLSNMVSAIVNFTKPIIIYFLNTIGYDTGVAINTTTDVVVDASKASIDIAGGAIQDVGNLLKNSGNGHVESTDQTISNQNNNQKIYRERPINADSSASTIQRPISAGKQNWCLAGEYQNKRGCVAVGSDDLCMSGQIYPTKQMCLNPTFTQNAS